MDNPGTYQPRTSWDGSFTKSHILHLSHGVWNGIHIIGNRWEYKAWVSSVAFKQATLALLQGEVDWAGNCPPAIERIFVERDPNEQLVPTMGAVSCCIQIIQNTFDDSNVRKPFLSVSIEDCWKVALHNYVPPADESGLSSAYDKWHMENGAVEIVGATGRASEKIVGRSGLGIDRWSAPKGWTSTGIGVSVVSVGLIGCGQHK